MRLSTPVAVRSVLLAALFLVPLARAQDATVGDVLWSGQGPAPDTMPIVKSRSRPDYPEEMQKTDGAGYVLVSLQIDSSGRKVGFSALGSHLSFQRAVEASFPDWEVTPAKHAGKPVGAHVSVPVVFHPKSAAAGAPEATPRLLPGGAADFVAAKPLRQKAPVFPEAMRRNGIRGQVTFDFWVDEQGAVQNWIVRECDNRAVEGPALAALREWKYTPATRGGKPVATQLRLTITFGIADAPNGGESAVSIAARGDPANLRPELRFDTAAKLRDVVAPVYPYAQRRDHVRGKARAAVLIDPQGQVAAVKILSADQPEFGLAFAAALEGYKFDPALKEGKPVPHIINLEQIFTEGALPDQVADGLLALENKQPEKIVEASVLDSPLRVVSRRAAFLPTAPSLRATGGEAVVECVIAPDGRAHLPRIVSASHPALGYAAVQASSTWWFEPPKAGGKPTAVRTRLPFTFHAVPAQPGAVVPAVN